MIVKDIMQKAVATCAPDGDLGSIIDVMRARDCGFLPVVNSEGIVVGVITDRDVCIAAGSHRPVARISVRQTMSHPVFSCFSDDNLKVALATMAKHRVRRLPVLNKDGHLEGVLSVDDIVQAPQRPGAPTADDVVDALKGIYSARPIEAATM